MGNQQETVTQFELGWLIGIIDGEGSFWIGKSPLGMTPVFEIVNTNYEIIEKISYILNKIGVGHHIYVPKRNSGQREYKKLEVKGLKRLKTFFDFLMPHFDCRYNQANLLREFVEVRLSKVSNEPYGNDEMSIYFFLRKVNQRGTGSSETTREAPKG